jgi:hypothetical protein
MELANRVIIIQKPVFLSPAENHVHPRKKFFMLAGFGEKIVGPEIKTFQPVFGQGIGAQHNDRDMPGVLVLFDPAADLKTVGVGQDQIKNDNIQFGRKFSEGFFRGGGDLDIITAGLQQHPEQLGLGAFIINQKNVS